MFVAGLLLILVGCNVSMAPPPVTPSVLEVELLATDPPMPARLAVGDTVYFRVGYRSNQPIRIQAQGFRGGEPVRGGHNGSPAWPATEVGEAFAWFFVSEAGRVDELRVDVSDAVGRTTFTEFTFPLRAQFVEAPRRDRVSAPWVAALRARAEELSAAAAPPAEVTSVGTVAAGLLGTLLIGAIFAVLVLALVLPLAAAFRWQPPWRWAACVAVALFVLPLLNVMAGVARDPTSHNLWPLELLGFALASLLLIGVLTLLRRRRV